MTGDGKYYKYIFHLLHLQFYDMACVDSSCSTGHRDRIIGSFSENRSDKINYNYHIVK